MNELRIKRALTLATPSVKFEKDKKSLMTIMPAGMGKLFLRKPYKEIVTVGEMIKKLGLDSSILVMFLYLIGS